MKLTLQDLIKATGGKCLNPESFGNNLMTSISTDTRQIVKGSLFVPIKGERFDGHHFIEMAYKQGAIATLTENTVVTVPGCCHIQVQDTKKALGAIAHYYRSLFNIPVIAVTGSVGKTSTKDLIAAVLSAKYNVHKTEGNFNNDIGLPLTLFKLEECHEMAILEMGMNHFGEIHYLSEIAEPDMAVITNIGLSHIENLGSQEGILKAKLEILDGLKEEGLLIVNGDDKFLNKVDYPKLLTYGAESQNIYKAINIKTQGNKTTATLITPKDTYEITLNALGEHMIYNGLVAVAIAEHFELTKDQILTGFLNYASGKMRMNRIEAENGLTLIDDTYNASPDSMCAALKVLENYETVGRKVAVLGDMFEMGEFAPKYHKEIGKSAAKSNIDILCTIGELAYAIHEGAGESDSPIEKRYYKTKETFLEDCHNFLRVQDTILFKASRGMQFEKIVEAIRKVNLNEK